MNEGIIELVHHLEKHFLRIDQRFDVLEHKVDTLIHLVKVSNPELEKLAQKLEGPTEDLRQAVEKNQP